MTNLDSIFKSRDITLPKGPSSQGYGFSCGHVWMWELDCEEGWAPKIDAFELWCWRRLLRVPWTARRSNQFILKEINPGISFHFFKFYFHFILLYHTVLVLSYIDMNPPWVYTSSQCWITLPPLPHIITLDHPHAPAPSILFPVSNIDWHFVSYMIVYMFQFFSYTPAASPRRLRSSNSLIKERQIK